MQRHTRKITKQDYLKCKEEGYVPKAIKEKYIEIQFLCGYGVYDSGVCEKDGGYFMWFDTGDSCD